MIKIFFIDNYYKLFTDQSKVSAFLAAVFPLTLARWPMASEHCWQTSDFLSYWPRSASGISTTVESKKRKTKSFS